MLLDQLRGRSHLSADFTSAYACEAPEHRPRRSTVAVAAAQAVTTTSTSIRTSPSSAPTRPSASALFVPAGLAGRAGAAELAIIRRGHAPSLRRDLHPRAQAGSHHPRSESGAKDTLALYVLLLEAPTVAKPIADRLHANALRPRAVTRPAASSAAYQCLEAAASASAGAAVASRSAPTAAASTRVSRKTARCSAGTSTIPTRRLSYARRAGRRCAGSTTATPGATLWARSSAGGAQLPRHRCTRRATHAAVLSRGGNSPGQGDRLRASVERARIEALESHRALHPCQPSAFTGPGHSVDVVAYGRPAQFASSTGCRWRAHVRTAHVGIVCYGGDAEGYTGPRTMPSRSRARVAPEVLTIAALFFVGILRDDETAMSDVNPMRGLDERGDPGLRRHPVSVATAHAGIIVDG